MDRKMSAASRSALDLCGRTRPVVVHLTTQRQDGEQDQEQGVRRRALHAMADAAIDLVVGATEH